MLTIWTNCQSPNFAKMSFERKNSLKIIRIPLLNQPIFTRGKKVMSVWYKSNRSHIIIMRENGLVTIAKIQTPNFDVFVRTSGDDQCGIVGDVHG